MAKKYKFNGKEYKHGAGNKTSLGYLIFDIFKYYLSQNSNKTYSELQRIFNPLHKEFSGQNSSKKVLFNKHDFLQWYEDPNITDSKKHERYFGYGKYGSPISYNNLELYFTR